MDETSVEFLFQSNSSDCSISFSERFDHVKIQSYQSHISNFVHYNFWKDV